jgi:ATP-binding cassette subfamily F protein 3
MRIQIADGTVSVGGRTILSHIDFEVRGNEKIAIVGRNGAGKTTLLKLIAGELTLDRDDKRNGPGILRSRALTVGMLRQQAFQDETKTVQEEMMSACPAVDIYDRERYEYQVDYDILFTGMGFAKEDRHRKLSSFSGGEKTKLALIRLLLEKPDILLLDEPTNHLDLNTVQWLEGYLRNYEKAVVMVSHDRFFLDRTADTVYELEGGELTRYSGSYTDYREQKRKNYEIQKKAYARQQEEIERQKQLIERFRHKPSKASFARSRKKMLERMEKIPKPAEDMAHIFTGDITPLIGGSKWVLEAEHLKIGYGKPILELSLRIRRGQKIGILGENGSGKTTFLKTAAGFLEPVSGVCSLGNNITIGYFDQFSAEITSDQTVAEHFGSLFPSMTDKELRSTLGAYLFKGRDAAKKVSDLSGGEKARLVLAELLESRPNFLILDEPTNHMDIQAKETLESAFRAYQGTILFVSHDRYFIRQVAQSILIFEGQSAMYYPFGYEHYLERMEKERSGESPAARIQAEEQALIAGLKAVPKAERHRLREIPTEEAYDDWRLRLARERMEAAEETVKKWEDALLEAKLDPEYWKEVVTEMEENVASQPERKTAAEQKETPQPETENRLPFLEEHLEASREEWQSRCMEWYEIYLDTVPEITHGS